MPHEDSTQALRAVLLPGLGVLRIAGPDAVSFLQGQFTHDTRLLADGRSQLTACCTNQGRVVAVEADVSDADSVERAAQAIEREFGKIHVVCNNAGVAVRGAF